MCVNWRDQVKWIVDKGTFLKHDKLEVVPGAAATVNSTKEEDLPAHPCIVSVNCDDVFKDTRARGGILQRVIF